MNKYFGFIRKAIAMMIVIVQLSSVVLISNAEAITVINPIVKQRADPWVYKHTDGYYYMTASVPEYDRIELRRATTIQGLSTATPTASPIAMWAGDVTRNGVQDNAINMADIIEFAACFNATSGNAKYKEAIDINKDGSINMSDIIIVARNFGKTSADYQAIF
ncbi:MAG TPA: dockerin type I domain-containing protein [Pseudobacteroides sp.]|nr:dockerin type I domain-containing protein [Pseudobacteroides sp.]